MAALLVAMSGCASGPHSAGPTGASGGRSLASTHSTTERTSNASPEPAAAQSQPESIAARTSDSASLDASVREQAAMELGEDVAASMPRLPESTPVEPVDPGAAMIVRSIAETLADRRNVGDAIAIDLTSLQNLSRSGSEEFTAFVARLAALLTRAGSEHRIRFVEDKQTPCDYRMLGTAYLVSANGFDQWEMYLSLTPSDRDWQVWDARNAIRMLRTARVGQPQITYIGK